MPRSVENFLPQTHGNSSCSIFIVRSEFPVVIGSVPMDSLFSPPFRESWEHLFFIGLVASLRRQGGELAHRARLVFPSVLQSFLDVLQTVPGSQWSNHVSVVRNSRESWKAEGLQRRNPHQASVSALNSLHSKGAWATSRS